MDSKILDIIDSIAYEKGLKNEDVELALKDSLIKTANRLISEELIFDCEFNRTKKTLKLFQKVEVVAEDDPRLSDGVSNQQNFIELPEAKKLDNSLEIGDFVQYDLEFENLGRTAAGMLHNNLEYKIQRIIEENIFNKYKAQVGKIISASVISIDSAENTIVEIGEVRGILERKNRIKGESFKIGNVIKAVVKSVKIDKKAGLVIELSRTSPKFLEALLRLEVPELKDDKITIHAIARIPGERAKVAVSSNDPAIDPIGSIVGVKGVRISEVSKVLKGESIDCVEFSPIPEKFIARSLSPAIINGVKIKGNEATVSIYSDQKSKAIGRAGLNIRLASMLTKLDIKINEVANENIMQMAAASNEAKLDEEKSKDLSSLEALFKM